MKNGADLKIVFLGDVMPGGVLNGKSKFVAENVLQYLTDFDLRVATLECAIGDDIEFDRVKMRERMNIIYAKDSDIQKIEVLNINVAVLANNHIFDLGIEGFQHVCQLLDERKILYCGAGMNTKEAAKPAVVEIKGKRVCFYAYCQYNTPHIAYVPIATENSPGINPLDIDQVITDIIEAKKVYDYVFVIPHWGIEYISYPTVECKRLAYKMIEAGADGVIGSHPHRVQPSLSHLNKPIFFSLGNFLFADFFMAPPRPIWYPSEDEIELGLIRQTFDYPFPVTEPMKRVWRNFSRIGMLAEIVIGKNVIASWRTTYLGKNNKLDFYSKQQRLRMKLYLIRLFVETSWYDGGKNILRMRRLFFIKSYMRLFKKIVK